MLGLFLAPLLLGLIFLYHFMSWRPQNTSVLYKNRGFLLFGHRGAPLKEPENTIPSFLQAISDGCNAIELDVHCTKDGHLVVFHDETLERTTNGTGRVADHTLKQLQDLNAASLWEGRTEQIPTLKLLVDHLPDDIVLNFEVKVNSLFASQRIVQKTIDFIRENNLHNRVIISSFNPLSIWQVRRSDPGIFTALIWYEPNWFSPRHILGVHLAHPDILHPAEEDITPVLRYWCRVKNIPVHVWVVNDANRMKELAADPMINGIMSDDSQLLVKTVGQRK